MAKPSLYLETTIPSYLTAWPSRDLIVAAHQQITQEWWRSRREAFDIYVSQFVMDEAAEGDADAARERLAILTPLPLLEITRPVEQLAAELLQSGTIPAKAAGDAAHIAVCAIHGVEYLMTWNCAHLANATLVKDVQRVCSRRGWSCPIICTPEELMGEAP